MGLWRRETLRARLGAPAGGSLCMDRRARPALVEVLHRCRCHLLPAHPAIDGVGLGVAACSAADSVPLAVARSTAICLAALAASAAAAIERLGRWRWAAFAAAMALLILPNLFHLAPAAYQDLD